MSCAGIDRAKQRSCERGGTSRADEHEMRERRAAKPSAGPRTGPGGSRTRVAGLRNRIPRPLEEHDAIIERATRIELAWNSLEDCRLASRPHPQSPRSESNRRRRFTKPLHGLRAARAIPLSGRRDSNPSGLRWHRSAAPSGLVRARALGWTRTNTLPGKNRQLCIGATKARRATPRNRTRTSRFSAERADLLRKSGIAKREITPRSIVGYSVVTPRQHRVAVVPL